LGIILLAKAYTLIEIAFIRQRGRREDNRERVDEHGGQEK
jgi:hypothetical protein